MPMTKDQILAEVMALDALEREALAEQILQSVPEAGRAAVEAAWLEEARRREAEFSNGGMSTSPVDDVVSRVGTRARP